MRGSPGSGVKNIPRSLASIQAASSLFKPSDCRISYCFFLNQASWKIKVPPEYKRKEAVKHSSLPKWQLGHIFSERRVYRVHSAAETLFEQSLLRISGIVFFVSVVDRLLRFTRYSFDRH